MENFYPLGFQQRQRTLGVQGRINPFKKRVCVVDYLAKAFHHVDVQPESTAGYA